MEHCWYTMFFASLSCFTIYGAIFVIWKWSHVCSKFGLYVCSEKLFGLFNEYFEWFCSRTVSSDVKCGRVCEILFFRFDLVVKLNFADVHLEQTRCSQIIIIVQSNCDQAADFKDNNCTHHRRFRRGEAKRLRCVDPNHQFLNYNCSFILENSLTKTLLMQALKDSQTVIATVRLLLSFRDLSVTRFEVWAWSKTIKQFIKE